MLIAKQKVCENLPAFSVDLDKFVVIGWGCAEDEDSGFDEVLSNVIEAGTIEGLAWGKTKPVDGISDIIIDLPKVTQEALLLLAEKGII